MRMGRLSVMLAFAAVGTPVLAEQTFGETCTGTEIVQIGAQNPKTLPYNLTFSADLKGRAYCYGPCGKDQSFQITDAAAVPIRLADLDNAGQVRRLTFDPRTSTVSDYQVFKAGMAVVTRRASATCEKSVFHAPSPQNHQPH